MPRKPVLYRVYWSRGQRVRAMPLASNDVWYEIDWEGVHTRVLVQPGRAELDLRSTSTYGALGVASILSSSGSRTTLDSLPSCYDSVIFNDSILNLAILQIQGESLSMMTLEWRDSGDSETQRLAAEAMAPA